MQVLSQSCFKTDRKKTVLFQFGGKKFSDLGCESIAGMGNQKQQSNNRWKTAGCPSLINCGLYKKQGMENDKTLE